MANIDLLYPADEYRHYTLDEFSFIDELDLYSVLGLNKNKFDLSTYFTKSKEVIEYRNNILNDFIENDCFSDLEKIIETVGSISEMRESKKQVSDIISALNTIFEIEIYTNLIEYLNKFLNQYNFTSTALTELKNYVECIFISENYINLKKSLKIFRTDVSNVKSITVGVNLNDEMKPYEAGVVSVNTNKFRSGNLFDRILSLDIKNDGFRCLTPISPVRGDMSDNYSLMTAFNNALENIIKSNLKTWQPIIKSYVNENTEYFINMGKEIQFYCALIKYINKCRQNNLNIVKPEIVSNNMKCNDIYNIRVVSYSEQIVYNDIEFDENGQIYILTGPNQGGKSVFLKAIGINQALFQLGSYVHSSKASMKISPNIIVYLTKNDERSIGLGHLGEECKAVSELLKYAKKDCLFLFDEAFSSTSASDQCCIACEVLIALSKLKCCGLFITHNYDIYEKLKEITASENKDSVFDSLTALMSESKNSERSYRIVRKAPDRNSFALDIAKKYNLQCEDILRGVTV